MRAMLHAGRTDWINVLSPQHVAELDAAVSGVQASGIADIHVSMLAARMRMRARARGRGRVCWQRTHVCMPSMLAARNCVRD
jgi:hypothetical protein